MVLLVSKLSLRAVGRYGFYKGFFRKSSVNDPWFSFAGKATGHHSYENCLHMSP